MQVIWLQFILTLIRQDALELPSEPWILPGSDSKLRENRRDHTLEEVAKRAGRWCASGAEE